MTAKLKRGRLWFIACKTPIPWPQDIITTRPVSRQVNLNLQGSQIPTPTLRPLRQPLYDGTPSSPAPVRTLFQNFATGEQGYYWTDGEEVIWRQNWDNAIGFDTREDAETHAFEVVMKFPNLLGKLIVLKLKVRYGVRV